jgi:CheY-like chemotaxis protein
VARILNPVCAESDMLNGIHATTSLSSLLGHPGPSPAALAQKVVIVNGSPDILELLETVLEAGHYDVVFVESSEHAYSQVKRVRPNLIILCVRLENMDGFQVLSMLKLDEETRTIPLLTYTLEADGGETESEDPEPAEESAMVFSPKPAVWMN